MPDLDSLWGELKGMEKLGSGDHFTDSALFDHANAWFQHHEIELEQLLGIISTATVQVLLASFAEGALSTAPDVIGVIFFKLGVMYGVELTIEREMSGNA